jgi:hypothetical protein
MRRPILVVAGAALVAALTFAAAASAHFDTAGKYTQTGCPGNGSNQVDPINIVFYNWGTWDRGQNNLEYHAGWRDGSGGTQYCGHAVDANGPSGSGFDQGRREVRIRVGDAAGHSWYTQNWGNTNNFQQCDGDWARSDGIVTFINLHQGYH